MTNRLEAVLETLIAVQADYDRCLKNGYSLPRDLVEAVDEAVADVRRVIEDAKADPRSSDGGREEGADGNAT